MWTRGPTNTTPHPPSRGFQIRLRAIHRKPGYDPVELFIDPKIRFPKLKIASFLLKKKLGMRALLDVIPLDATLVKGSHGRDKVPESEQPIFISRMESTIGCAEDVAEIVLESIRG